MDRALIISEINSYYKKEVERINIDAQSFYHIIE